MRDLLRIFLDNEAILLVQSQLTPCRRIYQSRRNYGHFGVCPNTQNDTTLLSEILAKARLHKGLSHREAAVLLLNEDPAVTEQLYKLANQIKLAYYGNRIVIFAPLYLSNYCVNGCTYCPYHAKTNTSPARS